MKRSATSPYSTRSIDRGARIIFCGALAATALQRPIGAHEAYLMNSNHTNPSGLASIWAGSSVDYTWKGVCGCVQSAPDRFDDELFIWQGPDDKTLLFKWDNFLGSNGDWCPQGDAY